MHICSSKPMNMKKITRTAGLALLSLFAATGVYAQCTTPVLSQSGTQFTVNAPGAAQIQWYKNGVLVSTTTATPALHGTTAAGGTYGSANNQFYLIRDVFVDKNNNIYTSDAANRRIQRWAPGATSGVTVAGNNGVGSDANQFWTNEGLWVDTVGTVYVADNQNNRVQKWISGAITGTTAAGDAAGNYGSDAAHLWAPRAVWGDKSGNIYVADRFNNRVQKWAPGATTGITVAGGTGGTGANQLQDPAGVFVDATGNIYVSDLGNERVVKWVPGATSGVTVAGGTFGYGADRLNDPNGIFVDGTGAVYIADYNNARIQKWAPGATSGVTVAGQANGYGIGGGTDSLSGPTGVAVDCSGNVYVADGGNNRVQKWAQNMNSTFAGTGNGQYKAVVTTFCGCVITSNIIQVGPTAIANLGNGENGLTIAPNPFTNEITLSFKQGTSGDAMLSFFDPGGRSVKVVDLGRVAAGITTKSINTSDLPSGIYFYSIQAGNELSRGKLIKQ